MKPMKNHPKNQEVCIFLKVLARDQESIFLPVPTGEFPPGPASFIMSRSSNSVDFWDIHKVYNGNLWISWRTGGL